jgi:two-component system response regulator NreC
VLAEAHSAMRSSLRLLLESDPAIDLVAEAATLARTREHVRRHAPDVLVLDLRLPDGSCLDAIDELRGHSRRREVVVLTMHDSALLARRALDGGASGFVLKDTADAELGEAVRRAACHEHYTSPRITGGSMQPRTATG